MLYVQYGISQIYRIFLLKKLKIGVLTVIGKAVLQDAIVVAKIAAAFYVQGI